MFLAAHYLNAVFSRYFSSSESEYRMSKHGGSKRARADRVKRRRRRKLQKLSRRGNRNQ